MLSLLTDWPTLTVVKASVTLIVAGDIVLGLLMEAVSPTHVKVGPGERLRSTDLPQEIGKVVDDFDGGRGRIAIRGEMWLARQPASSKQQLKAGTGVRVLGRESLTLVVAAADDCRPE